MRRTKRWFAASFVRVINKKADKRGKNAGDLTAILERTIRETTLFLMKSVKYM